MARGGTPRYDTPRPTEVRLRGGNASSRPTLAIASWAGESDVANVEVSDDDGQTWRSATLVGEPVRYARRFWEYDWPTRVSSGRRPLALPALISRSQLARTVVRGTMREAGCPSGNLK
jgi:hypothetical protein